MDSTLTELIATGPSKRADEASEIILNAGSSGVEWLEMPATAQDKTDCTRLKGYLPGREDDLLTGTLTALKKLGFRVETAPYKEIDWSSEWKKGLKPVKIWFRGAPFRIVVRPPWCEISPGDSDIIIDIEPAMAFGTGHHPTTRCALKALLSLSSQGAKGATLLDVGAGSGVLAIAGSKLGFKKVTAIEIDPVALKAARRNARDNNVKLSLAGLSIEKARGRFDVVVANIISSVLIKLATSLTEKTAPRGLLILSGILSEESAEVEGVFSALGFKAIKRYNERDRGSGGFKWTTLILSRKKS